MTQNREVRWVRLGDFIEQIDERNKDNSFTLDDLRGLSIQKKFISTKANMDGVSLTAYKLVPPKSFCYVTITSRNSEKITLALNETAETFIVSSSYIVFKCIQDKKLLPEYLFLWYYMAEFDRYARFNSWGSARESFSWLSMQLVKIPVPYKDGEPDVDRQQEIVDVWQGLRRLKEENEALAKPLLELCDAKMDELKHSAPMVELGKYIIERKEINSDGCYSENDARGVNTEKEIQPCKRIGENLSSYKVVYPNDFVYNANIKLTKTTEKLAIALFNEQKKCIVTNFYTVFSCNSDFIPEFLFLWFIRDEFARYVKFMSCSSVRDRFDFNQMAYIKVPKPSLEVQKAIVDIYHCARRAKEIAAQADKKLKEICPALMQHIIHS